MSGFTIAVIVFAGLELAAAVALAVERKILAGHPSATVAPIKRDAR